MPVDAESKVIIFGGDLGNRVPDLALYHSSRIRWPGGELSLLANKLQSKEKANEGTMGSGTVAVGLTTEELKVFQSESASPTISISRSDPFLLSSSLVVSS